eukprot:UN34784
MGDIDGVSSESSFSSGALPRFDFDDEYFPKEFNKMENYRKNLKFSIIKRKRIIVKRSNFGHSKGSCSSFSKIYPEEEWLFTGTFWLESSESCSKR